MAGVENWRTCLNSQPFCKLLRENNAKDSRQKVCSDSKGLVAVKDSDLFVWDSYACHFIYFNLKHLLPGSQNSFRTQSQVLLCTNAPRFDVHCLTFNPSGSLLAVWGQEGITVVELPQRRGKFAEFEGGKPSVSCKSTSIAEHYFASHKGARLQQVIWHPGSDTDTHIAFLTSDNTLSVYSMQETDTPLQVIHLDGPAHNISQASNQASISTAQAEAAIGFDFGPPLELNRKQRSSSRTSNSEVLIVWPAYIIKGNGDIVVAYTDINSPRSTGQRPEELMPWYIIHCQKTILVITTPPECPVKLPTQGPLIMHPPAEDNYGVDACSIKCLGNLPLLVMATCEGKLHHCVVLPPSAEDSQSEAGWSSGADNTSLFESPPEVCLYVCESIELELTLTTSKSSPEDPSEEEFTCPIKLHADPSSFDRYHCSHAAGIHTVMLPWLQKYQQYCTDDRLDDDDEIPDQQGCIVEHLICTRPLQSSAPSPVLGMGVVRDATLGAVLLALTSDIDFVCLPLSCRYKLPEQSLVSTSPGRIIQSPLRNIHREPFHRYIEKILQRNVNNPLLKSGKKTEMSSQECFQLLSRSTQVFREEYLQKQDLAQQEIQKRVRILRELKDQQVRDLQELTDSQNVIQEKAQDLAVRCDDCQDKHEMILRRIESVMRRVQARMPMLSEAERSMKRELETMEEQLDVYKKSLHQLKVKQDYQHRQIQHTQGTTSSPSLKTNQMKQIKTVLQQEGEELADMVKQITQLKLDTGV